jgi:MerR family transcriptional regulator, copper efflux regulator
VDVDHMQIGEVAERVSLSLRTIRYYEEVGLAPPSARTQGGFRLYTESDVERLLLIRRMKPLDVSLEEMRDLLGVLDGLSAGAGGDERRELLGRLGAHRRRVEQRIEKLRDTLQTAESFAVDLRRREDDASVRS